VVEGAGFGGVDTERRRRYLHGPSGMVLALAEQIS
jgi:hypothetical protein